MIRQLLLATALAAPALAYAQYKVSELVAQGGQVMTAEQIRAEIAGSTISGTSEQGIQFEMQLARDGKLAGTVYTPRGASGISGTWTINAKNQICSDFVVEASGNSVQRCVWYWKAGGEYYATNSRSDDAAAENFVDCLMSGGKDCDGAFSVAKRSVRR
ncbi:MAG TPA: hypothetical protein VEU32_11995 [Burkholderiales bacterium]|nr:hypothetical protein [Burkholderiales bacterium]